VAALDEIERHGFAHDAKAYESDFHLASPFAPINDLNGNCSSRQRATASSLSSSLAVIIRMADDFIRARCALPITL
jgi:hypothetical protein